jgi:Family of unknown function (DUF6535)
MGLFSAVVAVMLSVTLQDLRQNPQDTSVFYLENLYKFQILADSNASLPSTPAEPLLFSAPKYAIWVNALFFMTLCLNLFTATLALLMQGCLPRHLLKIESPHLNQHRARMQEIIASELKHSRVSWLLGIMIQVSAWFFFAALVTYLFNVNRAVFTPVLCCAVLGFTLSFSVNYWLNGVSASHRALYSFVAHS